MKKGTPKAVFLLLAVLLLISSFTGCGSTPAAGEPEKTGVTAETTSTQAAPAEDVTLTFLRAGTDELAQKAYADLIEAYHAENENVTIEYEQYNFGSELETKLNTLYASGSAPDIVRAPISTIAQRASLGQYAELDSYIDSWEDKDNVMPSAYNVASYKGKRYGIAINIEASFLFYRKDHFIEAGLDPNKPPRTWEELLDYARKLTVREGNNVVRAGFSIPMSLGHVTIIPFARQNGALLVDEENNKAVFNDAKTAEALDYLSTFSKENLLIPYINNKDQNPFEVGNASMTYASLGTYNTIKASGVEWVDQILFAPGVGKEKISTFGGCQIMFLSEEGKHKDQAWDFVKNLFTDESVMKLVTDAGATPVKLTLSEQFSAKFPEIGPAYLESLKYAQGMPKVEWSALFEKYICIAYEEAMYHKKDAQTALNDALAQLNSELDQ